MSTNPAADTSTTVKTTNRVYEWAALALAVAFIAAYLSVGLRAGPFWILP